MVKKKKNIVRSRRARTRFMGVFFCLCLIALGVRVGYYITVWGNTYERAAVAQLMNQRSADEQVTNPNRGFILDRNRQPLAVSSRVYDIYLDVTILDTLSGGRVNHKANTLEGLNEILGVPVLELESLFAKDLDGKLLRPTNWKLIARDVNGALAMQVKDLRCVYLNSATQRTYTDPYLAPHTVGFIRGDVQWGLEGFYNTELVGEPGRIYRAFDQENNPMTEEILPVHGYSLVTTLDAGMQRIAQAAVDKAALETPCEFAGILVMEPYTGEILAIAQWPNFSLADPANPEFISDRVLRTYWDALSEEQRFNELYKVWGNYHTTRTFEPGSIFKPVVVAAALEENVINPYVDNFFCNGKIQVFDWEIPCWYKYGHGGQDTTEVLAHSCNVAMVEIINKLGRDRFFKYRGDFGFGERTEIDLPGEAAVSSPAVMYTLSQLNPVELATSAIGQGFNNTAIQAIVAFSAVINGGNVMKPYLVSQIVDEHENVVKENTPKIVRKAISANTSNFMREAMHSVVMPGGTAYRTGNIEGYAIGGKTGSGQQGSRDSGKMTVSYVAYTPVDNPEFIILGVLDNLRDPSQLSSTTVVPMVREAMEELIRYTNMLPHYGDGTVPIRRAAQTSEMADYTGMQFTEVSKLINNIGIDYRVIGSGTIVQNHIPAAGQRAPENAPVFFYLDADTVFEGEMVVIPHVEGLTMEMGEAYIREALLIPVSFIDKPGGAADYFGGDPVTAYPTHLDNQNEPVTVEGMVYKQFPEAGSIIQKGTQIKLKVRME
jgi:stage V sporulation protein D (sporulation-specific penicillin-binding protein)